MKLLIFLYVLAIMTAIPTRAWSASSISPNSAHRVVSPGYRRASGTAAVIFSEGSAINARGSASRSADPAIRSSEDEMRITLIVSAMAVYLIALVSWTISAKGSLDRVLKHVIQSMARY